MMPPYDGGWMWSMAFGMLFMVLFWVVVIAGSVWLALTLLRRSVAGGEAPRGEGALRILEERLARGEIDLEEFRTRKAALLEARR